VNPWGGVSEQEVYVSYQNYVVLYGGRLWKTGGGNIELVSERIMTAQIKNRIFVFFPRK